MRNIALALLLALAGCEGQTIMNCGYACKEAQSRMLRYSPSEGCVCEHGEKKQ